MSDPASFANLSARHSLPFLFAGQAQKEFTVNEALARIDFLLHPTVLSEVTSDPVTPAPGDCYLVAAGATGQMSDHADDLAAWDGNQWTFLPPVEGMVLRDLSNGDLLRFDQGWQRIMAPAGPSGGTTVDSEARTAVAALIAALQDFGIFSSS